MPPPSFSSSSGSGSRVNALLISHSLLPGQAYATGGRASGINRPPSSIWSRAVATKQYSSPPAMQVETDRTYKAVIETEKGSIEIELFPEHAPITVNNFVFLARDGFYDGVVF
ncbi:MAG: peptidylprolyl isomerase, partial [Gammaproteobacteria bacterium]|nr:peptidylprolyl isomerase [Gammaproteobacteria bacterium]